MNPYLGVDPQVIEKLKAWGGKTPHGDPMWRLILAENHLVQRAGTWTEFEEGTEQVKFGDFKDGGLPYETKQIAPYNIKTGIFWVPRYPCTGWILERWFPASSYGSREMWEAALSQDGQTPMMGPWPEHGLHYLMDGPWEYMPHLEAVRETISRYENDLTHTHGRIDETVTGRHMDIALMEMEEREAKIHEAFLMECDYALKNNLGFIKNNPHLSRFRNHLASQQGITGHI